MHEDIKLTIHNWKSEYQRLETKYRLLKNKSSLEARGIMDHLEAVREIIKDIEDQQLNKL